MKKFLKFMLLISILLSMFIGNYVYAVNTTATIKSNTTNENVVNEESSAYVANETKNLAQNSVSDDVKEEKVENESSNGKGIAMIAAALATGLACIGAGIAVAVVASSAVGAVSENPSLLGKTIIFAGLAEGIAIYGLIISIMILNQA